MNMGAASLCNTLEELGQVNKVLQEAISWAVCDIGMWHTYATYVHATVALRKSIMYVL